MEVRPGYKRTEVGLIPEDWEVKRIGDISTAVRGASPRPAGDPRYFNGDFMPVDKLEDKNVSTITIRKGRIVAGTDREGILYKTNNILKILIEPFEEPQESMISSIE